MTTVHGVPYFPPQAEHVGEHPLEVVAGRLAGCPVCDAALVRTPETLPEEPAQLGCGCLVGVHESTMRETHPEIVWPTDDGLAHYYWAGSHGVADGGNVRTPETLDVRTFLALREAAHDVVIQEGRYYERDGSGESKFLAVVPKSALSRLRAALRSEPVGPAPEET